MFAVMRKELRATAWVFGLAVFSFGWFLWEYGTTNLLRPYADQHLFPLLHPDWLWWYGFISASFAGGLGLVLSLNDGVRGTWAFGLFRPISRRAYIAAKLLVGSGMTLVIVGVPALVCLIQAALPGGSPWPFDWSCAQPVAEACGWGVVVFLGGFLSGIRPASWWWSRLWPLARTVLLGLWFWFGSSQMDGTPDEFTPSGAEYWVICAVMVVMLVTAILSVVDERDFA
jgi:ABC-type transport system involved in multi-copper enzyme maturation permease subunit